MRNHNPVEKTILTILIIIILLLSASIFAQEAKKIIYETDMCADVDDAGGLAILHAMANNGEVEILAVCFNEVHPDGVAAIDAMNTWYARGDIPVGIYRGNLSNPDGSGYLGYVADFPHDLEDADAPSALEVYRQVLAAQPDSSVTIVSVGFTNNLNDLLIAEPELVAQKVKELVQMAGVWNDGFNLVRHNLVSVSQNVIENWPSPLVISQEGGNIYTGDNYQYAPEENPYREAFYRYFGSNFNGRSSWDEMAVLYGVRGLSSYFSEETSGTGRLPNGYVWQMQSGFRSYLTNRLSNSNYEQIIEDLMDQWPIGAHFNVSGRSGWLPFQVNFDASITNMGGGRPVQAYQWNFGDGIFGDGETVTHEYTAPGLFDVQLTVIDNLGDSLIATDSIRVSDPVFSPIDYFGNVQNYEQSQVDLWSTRIDSNDLRLFLSNEPRNSEEILPGFSFIKDSTYSSFTLSLKTRTGEDIPQNRFADYVIIFGYQNEDNYNYLLMKYTTSRLVNVANRLSTDIARITKKGIADEGYHRISLNLSGDQFAVTVDDSIFLTAASTRLAKVGKIGFGSHNYAVFFDDISVSGSGTSSIFDFADNIPTQFQLYPNYPNPFNASTLIRYDLPEKSIVHLVIYNSRGKVIRQLETGVGRKAGCHTIMWDGKTDHGLDAASGVYICQIHTRSIQKSIKLLMVK
ncbi:PKD domain-containing protein [candidate division KSB1 bacterium]|nr:PKD domain-containing protein [candidate division KSB1 bacterium]